MPKALEFITRIYKPAHQRKRAESLPEVVWFCRCPFSPRWALSWLWSPMDQKNPPSWARKQDTPEERQIQRKQTWWAKVEWSLLHSTANLSHLKVHGTRYTFQVRALDVPCTNASQNTAKGRKIEPHKELFHIPHRHDCGLQQEQ